MSDDLLDIEINGQTLKARRGAMIIEAADEAGILIPRFCYHKKLSVAANCRMCLVEVERAPKPMPACATPVMDGMKVSTKSAYALQAQKSVMEFLLINHPLDCPICDQGGECELQDVAMGYGRDVSRFNERKRVVKDKDLGSLVATDMTRCIHCTRCVRFCDEVAGLPELGGTGRGEDLEIGTYVTRALESELSGNVIDVCPVGALTSKPFRFKARAWEVTQRDSVSPHDAVGSNLHVHLKGNKVVRVVPKENDAINEAWISDRDRFSYEGLYAPDRLTAPRIKQGDDWLDTDWETALGFAAEGLGKVRDAHGGDSLGALVSPSSTNEEAYLAQKLMRGLGSDNIDHRIRQCDFRDQGSAPAMPGLGQTLAELEQSDVVVLIGSDCRREQPLVNHRIRKAARTGASVMVFNPVDFELNYQISDRCIADPQSLIAELAGVARALGADAGALGSANASDSHRDIAERLRSANHVSVLVGSLAMSHPQASVFRALGSAIAAQCDGRLGMLAEGGNSAGAWLAGAVPHRGGSGAAGADVAGLIAKGAKGLLLHNIEPEYDCYDPSGALKLADSADFVVVLSVYASETMSRYANVILPVAPFTENEGTLINIEGVWQSFCPVATPMGEARPAWKVLRVLGNQLSVDGFDYLDVAAVGREFKSSVDGQPASEGEWPMPAAFPDATTGLCRIGNQPMYAVDAVVRRAHGLQHTVHAGDAIVRLNAADADKLEISSGERVRVSQDAAAGDFEVSVDDSIASGCVQLPAGPENTTGLGPSFGAIELKKA